MTPKDMQRPFVEKAASDTREYLQELFEENQRLKSAISEMEVILTQRDSIEAMLKERVASFEEESRRSTARYMEIEQQNANLANLYVASYQLNGTLDRQQVVQSIQEIVINLIGCEEFGVWEIDEASHALRLVGSFGIDASSWSGLPLGRGLIGTVASTGQRYIADGLEGGDTMTACIPLKLDERVVGVIGIFHLLPQKPGLEPVDFELFDLLASHAATALYCTRAAEGVTVN